MFSSPDLRKKFLDFFAARGHVIVPSSSLLPDDPSVLLTTAGMQQFKRYYTGIADPIKDFGSKNTASIQKSFRTSDIDEVGDESHLTFFEMLGNFSFGGYFKKEAIQYGYEFIAKELGLTIDYVSVFGGDPHVPKDSDSRKIWEQLGIRDIRDGSREDNFWGPTGAEGPCGPTTEIYIKNAQGKSIEIWNIVFNEYYCRNSHKVVELYSHKPTLEKLAVPGVDTGMGLERLAMVVQNKPTIFETDLFKGFPMYEKYIRSSRIFADHIRGTAFLIADGIRPSNKGVDYVLRRLIRRMAVHAQKFGEDDETGGNLYNQFIQNGISSVIAIYGEFYPEFKVQEKTILKIIEGELIKFMEAFGPGLREFNNLIGRNAQTADYEAEYKPGKEPEWLEMRRAGGSFSAKDAFHLYQSYGFPREVMKDLCEERGIKFDNAGFNKEFEKHQEISRAGVEKKFGGHGLVMDTGELKAGSEEEVTKVTRLHTATHLLNQVLHDVLGDEIEQRGSDITSERTRFDFAFSRKVTAEELKKIENIVNEKIKADLPIQKEIMPLDKALAGGARAFFKLKYPLRVSVYSIGDSSTGSGQVYSKELCGGPHVSRTSEIGKFKIIKEESSSAGIRRIRAIVEP